MFVIVLFRGMSRWGEFDNLNHIDEEETAQDGSESLDSCATGCVPFSF